MTQRFFLAFFLLLGFSLIFLVSLKYTSGDFDIYYEASQLYLAKAPIYTAHSGINEFKYSPLFALFFSPLTLISKIVALYVWTFINILFLFAIFFVLSRLKLISFSEPKDFMIAISLFALTGQFLFADFRLGQVNVLLCLLMVLIMYYEMSGKYFSASVVLAFSLMIKFFPLLFVFYFLLKRRFKLLGYTALMLAVFLVLPSLYTGFNFNLGYLREWLELLKSTPVSLLYSFRNNSLLAFYSWLFIVRHEIGNAFDYLFIKKNLTPGIYYAWGSTCFVLFVCFFKDVFNRKADARQIDYLDYSCLFVCCLLFNPLAYLNAFVLLFVPYFFILRECFYSSFNKKDVILIGSLLGTSFILTHLGHKEFFKDESRYYSFLEMKPLMWAVILVFIILCFIKFRLKVKS